MNEKKEATLTKAKAELREKRKKLKEAQKTPEKSSSGKSKSSSKKRKRERLEKEKSSSGKSKTSSQKKKETLEKSSSGKDAKKPRSAKSKTRARKKEKDKGKGLKKSSSEKVRKSKSEVKTIPSTDKDLKISEKNPDNEKPEVSQKKDPEKKRSKDVIRTQSTNTIKKKSMDDTSKKEDQSNKINCKCPEITGTERNTALCMSGEKKKEVQDVTTTEVKTEHKKKKKTSNDLPNELDRKIYKTKCDEFKPQVYSFSAPSKTGIQTIQSPPFWLLVDHLIAVTWKLYFNEESEKKGLGITQLQWAYEFLMTMKHEDGELKEPMNSLAKLIEEALIALYSNLAQTTRNEEKKEPSLHTYKSTDTDDKKVSYTLDDILLRAPKMQNKEKQKEKPVKKPKLENDKKTLDKQDVLKYLQHIKKEQMEKANREKVHLEEIDEVIKLVQNDKFDETWKSKPGEKNP